MPEVTEAMYQLGGDNIDDEPLEDVQESGDLGDDDTDVQDGELED